MGVPNFRFFLSLGMRADLNNFGGPESQHGELSENLVCIFFGRKKFPNSQPKFLFVNSEFFLPKKITPNFPKVRRVGSQVHQKLFKSARIPSGKILFGFLLGSACMPGGVAVVVLARRPRRGSLAEQPLPASSLTRNSRNSTTVYMYNCSTCRN